MPEGSTALWRRGITSSVLTGIGAGILWWLLAPGGAFYGAGTDFFSWLPRDAVLAGLLIVAGALSAVLTMRRPRPRRRRASFSNQPGDTRLRVIILLLSGFLGAVIAWRMGVFAGDLFQTPPENMPHPSMVFSLRSGPVLLFWPLTSALVVWIWTLISYSFVPVMNDSLHEVNELNG
ncbi:hypothetical protein [Arthrobacter psychrolactophilus]